jgi:hypothetical protein
MSAPSDTNSADASPSAGEIRKMRAIFADGPFGPDCVFGLACEGEATP